jgi:hypothetical protein
VEKPNAKKIAAQFYQITGYNSTILKFIQPQNKAKILGCIRHFSVNLENF